MQLRRRDEPSVDLLDVESAQAVDDSADKRAARRAGVVAVDDLGGLREVDLGCLDDFLEPRDQGIIAEGIGEKSRVGFPRGMEHLAHWVDELDAVVLWEIHGLSAWLDGARKTARTHLLRVVARRDHDPDRLAPELLAPERRQQSDPKHDTVEHLCTA